MLKIRVPATSANLGPGFDSLGMALDMYNYYTFDQGQGEEDNLVHEAYRNTFQKLGKDYIPVKISIEAEIPISRGLGSSAACIVGGIMGALGMMNLELDKGLILELATEMEGHPDNVAPAIFGGLITSVLENGKVYTNNINIDSNYRFLAIIPDYTLSTALSRSVLPKEIPFKDGTSNISRVSLLISSLINGRDDLIRIGIQDKLHQQYRGQLIQGFDDVIDNAYNLGALGCYLSGAGPTIMCITRKGNFEFHEKVKGFIESNYPDWKYRTCNLENLGASLVLNKLR